MAGSMRRIYWGCVNGSEGLRGSGKSCAAFVIDLTPDDGEFKLALKNLGIMELIVRRSSYTLWSGRLDEKYFGKGRGASNVIQDNLELVRPHNRVIRDRSDDRNYIVLFPDVPDIINDILKRGIKIAVTSRNASKALCDRALWHYSANDKNDRPQSIISLVTFDEVGNGSKIEQLERIREWSGMEYKDMILFDSDSSSSEVQKKLGVKFKLLDKSKGLGWREYQEALKDPSHPGSSQDPPASRFSLLDYMRGLSLTDGRQTDDRPMDSKPRLGRLLGSGKFGSTYDSVDDPNAVIKVMKNWSADLRPRFLEISRTINAGKPFKPDNSERDQYLTMIAFELRNLQSIKQLKAPKLEQFAGWFVMSKIEGTLLWKTPLYRCHPFSVPFQRLVKTACHLAVDEIEDAVKRYGIEHRDAHLANVMFTMQGDQPVKAHLFDCEQGERYTPEEFVSSPSFTHRRYWITWMVKTEYEANMKRHSITHEDGEKFLKDLKWWFE
ncbi:hypothetical protein BDN67DRAFT_991610 [Paxillus ammoniavirescens]|nr:hypothetical protein BDN67DRAFT_991610 [Paxillus ammoniavirescens]